MVLRYVGGGLEGRVLGVLGRRTGEIEGWVKGYNAQVLKDSGLRVECGVHGVWIEIWILDLGVVRADSPGLGSKTLRLTKKLAVEKEGGFERKGNQIAPVMPPDISSLREDQGMHGGVEN